MQFSLHFYVPYHFFCAFFLSPVHLYVALLCCIWPRVHFKFQGEWITTSITTFLKNKNIADKKKSSLCLFLCCDRVFYCSLTWTWTCFSANCLQVPSYSIDCYFHLLSYTLSCKPYMSLSRWYSHRRWPGIQTLCAHTKWACSAAAAPGFTLLILRLNRHRSEATLRNTHTACLHCKHVQEPPSLTNLELRPCCLLWLSRLPHIWQDYPRNMTSVCMWATLWSIISSFVKRQHSRKEAHFTLQKRCFEPLSFRKNGGCPLDYESMSKCWNT